ncbi:MAG TPA: ABC transporter permease [Candidatus Angelobacter sp.]|nr:ABC transporter permease [Candidatus Angelobacter sp.]
MDLKDLVVAARVLRKSPVFALTAALTIALGVGASTAIFSVTNAVLLRPLPYRDPGRLVVVSSDLRKRNVRDFPLSNADFIDLREGSKSAFDDLAGVFTFPLTLQREDGTPEQTKAAVVTTNFFRLLGGGIAYGRYFNDDDAVPNPPPPPPGAQQQATAPPQLPVHAILSYEYFQRRYGGDPSVIGRPMSVAGGPQAPRPIIVGVLRPHFQLYFPPEAQVLPAPDIWIANRLGYDAAQRNNVSLRAVGRLRFGVTPRQAQAEAEKVAASERAQFPILGTADYHLRVEPMRQHMVAQTRPAILALMGSVIFLLLVACANVANLLLVRASLRNRELALRAALGANRWELMSPIFAEAVWLAALGTLGGVGLAWAGIDGLRSLAPADLPRLDTIVIDTSVLVFTALAGLAAAILFGMTPALRASRPRLMNVLGGASRNSGLGSGNVMRNTVITVEVALSFVLLVGSGLMFRSFLELQRIDPGFESRNLLTFVLDGNNNATTPEARAAFLRQVEDRLRSIPGVENVTGSVPFPLAGGFSPIRWGLDDALSDPSKFQATDFQVVLPGYFETMRTPLVAGRTFTEADNAPDRRLIIVDDSLAKKAFPGESAVGKRILIRLKTPEPEWMEIIGVVGHVRQTSLAQPGREQVYFTDGYAGPGAVNSWTLRVAGNPMSYASQVRAAIKELSPHLLITKLQPVDALVSHSQSQTTFSLLLIGIFAVIAGVLAGVGLYGVLSTAVRQRTPEIGVRMALGATRQNIFRLIVGQGLALSAIGLVIGLVAALLLTRLMTTMLVGIRPTDTLTFLAMVLLFLAIAAASSWAPANRAAGIDPNQALREE